MSLVRAAALRSSPSTLFSRTATRAVRRTTSSPCMRIGQQSGRRGYASASGTVKKTSDLPWAATALVVTTIGTYIAMSPSDPSGGHGHDDHGHGKDHEEHAEEAKEEEEPKEESKDEPEAKTEDKADEKSEDKSEEKSEEESEKSDDKSEDKPSEEEKIDDKKEDESKEDSKPEDKSEDKGEDKSDDTNAQKGATKDKTDIKHREEDKGKGATKVRMDSPAGKTIGEGSSAGEGDDMTKKQKGISTTDTKHSTDPHADPGKSSKGEGTAETAKIKGTVKPDRPQV